MNKEEKEAKVKISLCNLEYRLSRLERLLVIIRDTFYRTNSDDPIEIRLEKERLEQFQQTTKRLVSDISKFLVDRKLIWDEELKHKEMKRNIMLSKK